MNIAQKRYKLPDKQNKVEKIIGVKNKNSLAKTFLKIPPTRACSRQGYM